jgi:hypothetical protein
MTNLNIPGIEKGDIEFLLQNLDKMPKVEQLELLKLLEELEKTQTVKAKQDNFLDFAQAMDPNFLVGEHHKIIARTVERIASGDLKRVIINIAPRHGKSHIMSYLFPAWFMGKFPDKQIIMASHTADLAVDFGRKVRNLVADPEYKQVFPEVMLQADSKASGRWGTNHAGSYYACGVGGALAGRGAHLCCKKGTLVLTPTGYKTIETVQVGEYVLGNVGFAQVKKTMTSLSNQEVTINNKYVFTPSHPVWTENRGWVDAADIKINDILRTTPLWSILKSSITHKVTIKWLKVNQVIQVLKNIMFGL